MHRRCDRLSIQGLLAKGQTKHYMGRGVKKVGVLICNAQRRASKRGGGGRYTRGRVEGACGGVMEHANGRPRRPRCQVPCEGCVARASATGPGGWVRVDWVLVVVK